MNPGVDYYSMNLRDLATRYQEYVSIIITTRKQEGKDTPNTKLLAQEVTLMLEAFELRKTKRVQELQVQVALLQEEELKIQRLTLSTVLQEYPK